MLEMFVVGSFWFWALVVTEIVLLFVFVENENGPGATVSLVFGALLQWCGGVDILGFIVSHPYQIAGMISAYFVFGGVWGVCRWYLFCRDHLEAYEESKAEFLSQNGYAGSKTVPLELRKKWKTLSVSNNYWDGNETISISEPPRAKNNKGKILRWMTFWWVSMVWSFCNDFVKRVFRTIYNRIAVFLQRISDNMFAKANVAEDFDVSE